jgi:hypothetical protein
LPTLWSIGAEGVIIADKSLSKKERLVIVECLEFNYKVYVVPVILIGKMKRNFAESKELQIEDLLKSYCVGQ